MFADLGILSTHPRRSRKPGWCRSGNRARISPWPPSSLATTRSNTTSGSSYAQGRRPTSSHFNASWRAAKDVARYPVSKGTVILLHGFLQNRNSVTPWAIGWRRPDIDAQCSTCAATGLSTGKHISFGAFEARDVSAVIDDLGRRGWDVSRVGLLGDFVRRIGGAAHRRAR